MCPMDDGGLIQAGIVAWGIGCGQKDVQGGYINVASYVCWIKDIVEDVEGDDYFPSYSECKK